MVNLLKKGIVGLLFLTFFFSVSGLCYGEDISSFNLIGLRVGLWRMSSTEVDPGIPYYSASSKSISPYGELFFSYGLRKGFLAEFSLGSCDRGETKLEIEDGYYWESLTIYPISLGGRFYPLSFRPRVSWQPYLDIGVSYVVGSSSLEYGSFSPGLRTFFEGYVKTRSAFGAFVGAGLDFSLSRSLILNFDSKYRWVKFGEEVGGLKDYSGVQFTIGFAYVLGINR